MLVGGCRGTVLMILSGMLILVVYGMVALVKADTIVENDIVSDETWTSSLSPYIVKGDRMVDWNSTLTIESGVDVLFESNASLTVYGHLNVHGDSEDRVRFVLSNNAVPPWAWDGIDLHSDGNTIVHAEIVGARNNIRIEGSLNLVESCSFGSSDVFPISGGILIFNSAGPNYVLNSSFSVLKAAIALDEASNVVIAGNNIEDGDPGIVLFGGGYNLIRDNIIRSSAGADIQIFRDSYKNVMSNNLLSGSQSGVSCYGCIDNLVVNSTLESIVYDFKVYGDSKLTVLNTSFGDSKILVNDGPSRIYVKNFVHVSALTPEDMPVDGALVTVDDDLNHNLEGVTDSDGSAMWLEAADRTYHYSPVADYTVHDNVTTLTVEFEDWDFNFDEGFPSPRDVDMSTSHWEVFFGAPPGYEPPEEGWNSKPIIATLFSLTLVLYGLHMSRRTRGGPEPVRRDKWRRFSAYCFPFVLAEVATGILSIFLAFLAVPPVIGWGLTIDLTIFITGLTVVSILPREQPE